MPVHSERCDTVHKDKARQLRFTDTQLIVVLKLQYEIKHILIIPKYIW